MAVSLRRTVVEGVDEVVEGGVEPAVVAFDEPVMELMVEVADVEADTERELDGVVAGMRQGAPTP